MTQVTLTATLELGLVLASWLVFGLGFRSGLGFGLELLVGVRMK